MTVAVRKVDLPNVKHRARGKVREIFEVQGGLLLVATDRVSAFDVILEQGIPDKGKLLTRISEFWFRRLEDACAHHLISTRVADMPATVAGHAGVLEGRTMYVRELDIVPVECVVRGYLAGSGWKEYQRSRTVCGVPLPDGLSESRQLPEPIFTPTTKAATGHDEPMTFAEVEAAVGPERAAQLRDTSLDLYARGAAYARERGIILADTKFEFGVENDQLVLADEALTPDSSRYWDVETYAPGRGQDSFDKQIVRDWLETRPWNKQAPAPDLPDEVIAKARARYEEIIERLTK